MSDHEHEALDALRDLDGPAELGDGVEARIEAEMLARFDERVGAGPTVDEAPSTVVALEDPAARTRQRRSNRRGMVLATAAAVVLIVAGVTVFLARDEPAPTSPPSSTTSPSSTTPPSTTEAPSEEAMLTDQLATFCTDYLAPVRDADAQWQPSGVGSESRQNVLIAVENAAQAMSELDPPLGERLSESAAQLLADAADARLEIVLGSAAADAALGAVRDLLYDVPAGAGISALPDGCLR